MPAITGVLPEPEGTGELAVTGLGFEPDVVFIYGFTNDQRDTNLDHWGYDVGVACQDSEGTITQASVSTGVEHNTNPLTSERRSDNARFINGLAKNDGSLIHVAELTSFDADGFTIDNISVTTLDNMIGQYLAIGGSTISNAAVVEFQSPPTTGTVNVSGVGFESDVILFFSVHQDVNQTTEDGCCFHFGLTDGTSQYAKAVFAPDISSGGTLSRRCQYDDAVIEFPTEVYTNGNNYAVREKGSISSIGSDGFSVNFTVVQSEAIRYFAVCMKGSDLAVGDFFDPADTGTYAVADVGFEPIGLMLDSISNSSNPPVTNSGACRNTLGFADGTSESNLWSGSESAVNPSNALRRWSTDHILRFQTEDVTLQGITAFSSFDADGFTLEQTTNDGGERYVIYLAFGEGSTDHTASATLSTSFTVSAVGTETTTALPLTGAIVAYYDNDATTLRTLVGTDRMYAGEVPADVSLPYISVNHTGTERLTGGKDVSGVGAGYRIDRNGIIFDVFGTGKNTVHVILHNIELAYMNTTLTVENRTQIGRPRKVSRISFKEDDSDLWHGQLQIEYLLDKAAG